MEDVSGRLAAFIAAERDALAALDLVAVGWATVELDRAAAELASALDLAPGAFVPAGRRGGAWGALPGGC